MSSTVRVGAVGGSEKKPTLRYEAKEGTNFLPKEGKRSKDFKIPDSGSMKVVRRNAGTITIKCTAGEVAVEAAGIGKILEAGQSMALPGDTNRAIIHGSDAI